MLDTVTLLLLIIFGLYAWPVICSIYWFVEETDHPVQFVVAMILWPISWPVLLVIDLIEKARRHG